MHSGKAGKRFGCLGSDCVPSGSNCWFSGQDKMNTRRLQETTNDPSPLLLSYCTSSASPAPAQAFPRASQRLALQMEHNAMQGWQGEAGRVTVQWRCVYCHSSQPNIPAHFLQPALPETQEALVRRRLEERGRWVGTTATVAQARASHWVTAGLGRGLPTLTE